MTIKAAFAAAALAAAPVLAHAAAHPDFTGVWQIRTYSASLKPSDGRPAPLKSEAKAEYEKHLAAAKAGDRSWDETSICLPQGLPRLMLVNKPFQIMQRPKAVFFLHQENRLPHKAYFNEQLPTDSDGFYLGASAARWEGATLVVETNSFREGTFLDDKGLPHSDALHLTERYRMGKDGKTMTVSYTIDDPKTYTRTWSAKASFARKPASFEIPEEVCADHLQSTAPKR
ncbi:MAG: hypothetical protein WDN45_19345 [Caulobacteraceae bacterium]